VGAIEVSRLGFRFPGGRELFVDVSFRVGAGERAALVGANGAGKTTLLRILSGDEVGAAGTFAVDGRPGVLRQFVGSRSEGTTVRDLLVSLSPPALRSASDRLAAAEAALDREGTAEAGLAVADAWAAWGDAGGYAAELAWEAHTTTALRRRLADVAARPVGTLSGGEQKRLALEALLRGDDDVLLLDEPDNYLDVPGKEWLEDALRSTPKTVLFVSHDRELLRRTATKVVTLEGRGAWTHGGSFGTWHEAREARLARLDDEHRRWQDERRRLELQVRELRRRLQMTDNFATRLRATQTKVRRHEAAVPTERPRQQAVDVRLPGGRTGKRAVTIEDDAAEGRWSLGARVVPGHFSQTHEHPELRGRALVEVLQAAGLARGAAMSALRRYELQEAAAQPFETLSGGQQARLQILQLELGGATLLLLDEPTDNLDVASAEALEAALDTFTGTVLAVTHDRWFARSFDRFLVFARDGAVTEELRPVWS
jgi:ATPase subunit of ABC transporter with duplicated ATPase domains